MIFLADRFSKSPVRWGLFQVESAALFSCVGLRVLQQTLLLLCRYYSRCDKQRNPASSTLNWEIHLQKVTGSGLAPCLIEKKIPPLASSTSVSTFSPTTSPLFSLDNNYTTTQAHNHTTTHSYTLPPHSREACNICSGACTTPSPCPRASLHYLLPLAICPTCTFTFIPTSASPPQSVN